MNKLPVIKSRLLDALPSIRHGFYTRRGGISSGIYQSLNCGLGSRDTPDNVKQNRALVREHQGAEGLIALKQTHSTDVAFVEKPARFIGDGAITQTPDIALSVVTADCAPILFADKTQPLIAAAHAGWRGAVAGITDAVLKKMEALGADKKNIVAAIGPHIGLNAYEVGADMLEEARAHDKKAEAFFVPYKNKFRFDLGNYLKARLEQNLIEVEHLALCTFSTPDRFFSYRRSLNEKQADYGRQISIIFIAPHN